MADGEADLAPGLDGLPVVGDGFGEGQHSVFDLLDLFWVFGEGDEADLDVFLLAGGVGLEPGVLIPVEHHLGAVRLLLLKREVAGGYGWVFQQLDISKIQLAYSW